MEGRQLVKRRRRKRMMLRMIGHVPCEEAYRGGGQCGATVFQHVLDLGTARVFGQQKGAQKRLSDDCRDQPSPDQPIDGSAIEPTAKTP